MDYPSRYHEEGDLRFSDRIYLRGLSNRASCGCHLWGEGTNGLLSGKNSKAFHASAAMSFRCLETSPPCATSLNSGAGQTDYCETGSMTEREMKPGRGTDEPHDVDEYLKFTLPARLVEVNPEARTTSVRVDIVDA